MPPGLTKSKTRRLMKDVPNVVVKEERKHLSRVYPRYFKTGRLRRSLLSRSRISRLSNSGKRYTYGTRVSYADAAQRHNRPVPLISVDTKRVARSVERNFRRIKLFS